MENKISFAVEGFNVIDDYSDAQLAIVEVYVCHDGNNLHNMPISLKTLKAAKKTLKNKFLVAGYDGEDFEGHEPDEVIVGFFPESSKMSFKEKDGKTYLVAQAIMSKVYATWAYDIFVEENERAVSMEITVLDTEETDDGLTAITKFVFNGVTLLGKSHLPACEGSDASIIKFSKENALEIYNSKCFKSSDKIKKDFVNAMNLAENSGKEGTETMGEKEKEVEAVVNPEETVEVENQEFTQEEENVGEKDLSIENKEENPEENKNFESLTVEQKYEVFRAAIREKKSDIYLESFDDEYVYIYNYCDGFTYRYSYTLNGTSVELSDDCERVMRGGYVPFESKETEAMDKVENDENVDNVEMEALKTENCELKAKIAKYEEDEKTKQVEAIFSEVIDYVPAEKIDELREKAKEFSLEDINIFANDVKAIAFDYTKDLKGEKKSFSRMSLDNPKPEKTVGKYDWKK